jgi:methionyl-tRNA formyltransferase
VLRPARASDPEFVARLRVLRPDCCPVVAYGALLPPAALTIPRYGWINLHFSLLPAWRGAAPVQAAIAAGDEFTGAATFLIEEGLDTGPVFGVLTERIGPRDTTGELLGRLAESGAELLERTIDGVEAGVVQAIPQSVDGISYAPKITVESAHVRWDQPATAVERQIRAVTPAPGAWAVAGHSRKGPARIKIGAATLAPDEILDQLAPGQIDVHKHGVYVGTTTVPIRLETVQAENKRMMPAVDWARGARLADGEMMT